jgi:zinc protease
MTGTELLERIRPLERRLDNGLRLLVRADRAAPVVSIVTWVKAGYFDEPDDLVGISHVLEHMFFKGTARRSVGEIARRTKAAGGYLNAGTIYDHTSYYTVLPSDAADLGLELQADALMHSTIDEDELRKELRVIVEEVKRKLDNPAALAKEKLFEAMFDRHPMRRWRMGEPAALERLTRDDVVDYYRRMYRADNVVLVVSGDVDADRIADRVAGLYEPLESGAAPRPDRPEPDRTGARLREMSGDIGHVYVELGWRTPGTLHADTPALDALAMALGQGRASRLYRGVREQGLASTVNAFNYTPTEIGVLAVGLECEPDRTTDALRGAWAELDRVRAVDIGAAELARVQTVLEVGMLRRLETAEGRANLLAEWHALGDWRLVGEHLDRIRGMDADQIRSAAERYLDPGRATLLVYRPDRMPALGWADPDVPSRLAGGVGTVAAGAAALGAGPGSGTDRPGDGAAARRSAVATRRVEDGVVRFALGGGQLVVRPRPTSPLISMAVFRARAVARETLDWAGISNLMMRTSIKGTRTRSAERIALDTEALGGSVGTSTGPDLLSWTLTVPPARFEAGFDLVADVAFDPTFPDAEVARERSMVLASLDRLRDDMYRYPIRLLLKAAFGDHPYGHDPDDVAGAVDRITPDDLRRWHERQLGEPWILVVGDVEPDRVADIVSARWRPTEPEVAARGEAPRWPDGPARREVRRARAQTAIAVGFPGPAWNDPGRIPIELLSSAVSGLGNRLFEELRSRRSLAYTVASYALSRRDAGAFLGYIATSVDQADSARSALIEEIARLRHEPPSEEELERARRYTIGSWQIRSQTTTSQLTELATALLLGGGVADITGYEERVRAVTRDQVLEAAIRWLDPDRLAEGVVRGAD